MIIDCKDDESECLTQKQLNMLSPNFGEIPILKKMIFIKNKQHLQRVDLIDILWVKTEANYLKLYTQNKNYLIRSTLKNFRDRIEVEFFFKVHKSYLINLYHLDDIRPKFVLVAGQQIPIAKTYYKELCSKLIVL